MPISGVAFDLEGTLVDLEPAHHNAHRLVLIDLGVQIPLREAVEKIPHFIGGPHEKIVQDIIDYTGTRKSFDEISALDHEYFRAFRDGMEIKPRPGALEVIRAVRAKDLPIAIGSLTDEPEAHLILEKSGLDKEFPRECIVLKHDVIRMKPDPMVYQETAKRMGINPAAQLVFEDSPRGILAGKAATSKTVAMPVYPFIQALLPLHMAGAQRIFMDWRELNLDAVLQNLG